MNFSNYNAPRSIFKRTALLSFFVLTNFLCFENFAHPSSLQKSDATIQQDDKKTFLEREELLSRTLIQIGRVDMILEAIAQAINQEKVSVLNKEDFAEKVTESRRELFVLINRNYPFVTTIDLHVLTNFCHGFIEHIEKSISSDISQLVVYDISNWIPQQTGESITHDQILKQLAQNDSALIRLKKRAEEVGLTKWKKVCRFVDDHRILQRMGKAVLAGGITFWTYFYATTETFAPLGRIDDSSRFSFLKKIYTFKANILGEGPNINNFGVLENPDKLKYPGQLVEGIRQGLRVNLSSPIAQVPIYSSMLYPFKNDCLDWIKRLKATWHNVRERATGRKLHKDEAIIDFTVSQKRIDDLVGLDDVKDDLKLLAHYVAEPERIDRSGATIPKGYLLSGPTRTGKTYSGEALAGEINTLLQERGETHRCGFHIIKGYQLLRPGSLKTVIQRARRHAPCVLFIDEIHLLNLQSSADPLLLSDFLTEMSGLDQDEKNRVILVAATNKIENLEPALLQHGRFGKILHFENPKYRDRKVYFETELKKLTVDLENVDLDLLTRKTEGCSYGDLFSVVTEAQFKAKIDTEPLSEKHLVYMIDVNVRKVLQKPDALSQKEVRIVSAHQAGCVLAHLLLEMEEELDTVTIKPVAKNPKMESILFEGLKQPEKEKTASGKEQVENFGTNFQYGTMFVYNKDKSINTDDEEYTIKKCKVMLAGYAAEQIILGSTGYSCHVEYKNEIYKNLIKLFSKGINFELLPKKRQEAAKLRALEEMEKCELEIKELLLKHKTWLVNIATTLAQEKTLTAKDVEKIFEESEETVTEESDFSIARRQQLAEQPAAIERPGLSLAHQGSGQAVAAAAA